MWQDLYKEHLVHCTSDIKFGGARSTVPTDTRRLLMLVERRMVRGTGSILPVIRDAVTRTEASVRACGTRAAEVVAVGVSPSEGRSYAPSRRGKRRAAGSRE